MNAGLSIAAILGLLPSLHAANFALGGTDHTGYFALANVNTEVQRPDSEGGKSSFNMPYYYNPDFVHQNGTGAWFYLVTTPRSSANDYSPLTSTVYQNAFPEGVTNTVYNTSSNQNDIISGGTWTIAGNTGGTVVSTSAGTTHFGNFSYDESGVPATGSHTLTIDASGFTFDLTSLGPKYTVDNQASNNEFNWDYVVQYATGSVNLTFLDGQIISIDGTLQIGLAVRFGGLDFGKFMELDNTSQVATYDGTLDFSGNQFAFDVDDQEDVSSFLGQLTGTRLIVNRSGTIDGVVPEPSTALLAAVTLLGMLRRRR